MEAIDAALHEETEENRQVWKNIAESYYKSTGVDPIILKLREEHREKFSGDDENHEEHIRMM